MMMVQRLNKPRTSTMTAHELARHLLTLPDDPVYASWEGVRAPFAILNFEQLDGWIEIDVENYWQPLAKTPQSSP